MHHYCKKTCVWQAKTGNPEAVKHRTTSVLVKCSKYFSASTRLEPEPLLLSQSEASAGNPLKLVIEVEREADGRWLAEVPELPGVLSYWESRPEAVARVQALALRVLADRLEHGTRRRFM